ncbi:MAG: hypothetical protein QM652_07310 [Legionella sp.]|uniref:InlB B-repeat-containing protein n=1 Tax=Legionella sp. TaxID=459 RepID=UPI0039E47413
MNQNHLRNLIFVGASGLVLMASAQAGTAVWIFAPVAEYPPSVTISSVGVATVKYTVTNQSYQSHMLQMKPVQGITPSGCTSPLKYHQSCILTLTVNGGELKGDVTGGPVLCDQSNPNQCYQPSQTNGLAIRLVQKPSVQQYTVTSSAGANGAVSPSSTQTVNSGTTLTFTATADAGYGVNQWLVDGNLAQTGGTTYQLANITSNHSVNVTFGTVTLTPSVSTMALSINCLPSSLCAATQNAALTGNPRQITIQNTGAISATNVSMSSSGLPSGTSISSNNCSGTLNAGSSCTIILTPGNVASSDANNNACTSGTQPIANTVTITADSGLSSSINIYVLGYGCQYQGGFIYSIDDTTSNTGSIGGKVASLVDQAEPSISSGAQTTSIIWSSNGNGTASADTSYDILPGIDQTSTPSSSSPTFSAFQSFFSSTYTNINPFTSSSFNACQGNSDGQCNIGNILMFYNELITNYDPLGSAPFTASNGPTPLTDYAAGLCKATINNYSDWYLPAICEMDAVSSSVTCPSGTQSMLYSLYFLIGDLGAGTPSTSCSPPSGTNCLAGYYWSSTVSLSPPQYFAWAEDFTTGNNHQDSNIKGTRFGVRCSRALTS